MPWAPPSSQVFYDNSVQIPWTNVVSGAPFSWTHPASGPGSSAGTYALVSLYGAGTMTPAATITTLTFGGTTLSSLATPVMTDNTAATTVLWVFGGFITAGGSLTVDVELTQSGDTFDGFATSFTYNNVSSVGTLQTAFGSSTSAAVTVPSAPGSVVWGTATTNGANPPGFTGLIRQNMLTGSNQPFYTAGEYPGATSVAVTAPLPVNYIWAAAGLNLL